MNHKQGLERIVAWAAVDDNIRVVVLTGSVACGPAHVHALSDLDVELYVAEPAALLDTTAWYTQFGEVLVVEALSNPGWYPTRLVYYVDGKIDFMVGPVGALATTKYVRPFRVLLDKDQLTTTLSPVLPQVTDPPEATSFLQCINWFYAAALMCAKCVVRDEPWQAKFRDWDLKQQLMRMIEWDHKARYGWSYDAWSRGKHLKRWVDADVLTELEACWAPFDLTDTTAALLASVALFERMSSRTAHTLRLSPFDAGRVKAEITTILNMTGLSDDAGSQLTTPWRSLTPRPRV